MKVGQEGDKRRFRKPHIYDITRDIPYHAPDKRRYCESCGLEIEGKSYKGSESGKYLCVRCWNESA